MAPAPWQAPDWLAPLQAALPPLGQPGHLPLPAQVTRDYLSRYRLDFSRQMPGLVQELGWVNSGGCRLAVHRCLHPDATANLLLVHGYYDHSGLYGHLIEYGLARCCNVVVFDLPGHGLSDGGRAVIEDFGLYRQAVQDVRRGSWLPSLPWWTMAQSTGGSAVIDTLLHGDRDWQSVVLLAPLVRVHHWYRAVLAHAVLRHVTPRIARRFTVNSGDPEFLAWHPGDPLQHNAVEVAWVGALRRWYAALPDAPCPGAPPVLIVQGTDDRTVDWRYGRKRLARLFPGRREMLLPGARHQLANETPAIRAQYLAAIDDFRASLGQHADTSGGAADVHDVVTRSD